jgi:hypothetical protein
MTYEFPDCLKLIPNTSNPEAAFEDLMPDFLKLLQSGDRKELKRTRTALLRFIDEMHNGRIPTGEPMYHSCWTLMSLISAAQHQARVAENPGDFS